jgi:suppressor of fused protein SUFU
MSSGKDKPTLVSMSGTPIFRHGPAAPWQAAHGETSLAQISAHIEAHLGKADFVFHELVSDTVHIDVHIVEPRKRSPYIRLVTSGMSDLPMTIPDDADVPRFAELMVTLPETWALYQKAFKDESYYWPLRLLQELARLPHKHATWLGFGHSVPNGDPPEPYAASTKLCGAIILPSVTVPDEFHTLRIDEAKEITFFSIVPLYADELAFNLREGANELLDKIDSAKLSDVIDPLRRSVLEERFGIF